MAVNGMHRLGDEWKQKTVYRQDQIDSRTATIEFGLYHDATDSFTETTDLSGLTSEPSTAGYQRQSLSVDDPDFSIVEQNNDIQADGSVTFPVDDTGERVDGIFGVVSFTSTVVNDESSQNDHIVLSGTFSERDLTNYTDLTVSLSDVLV